MYYNLFPWEGRENSHPIKFFANKTVLANHTICPNKNKPGKNVSRSRNLFIPIQQKRFYSIGFLVNRLTWTCSTVPVSSVHHKEERKSQQVEEKPTSVIALYLIKIQRQFKHCGRVSCQGCHSVGRYERKIYSHSLTTTGKTPQQQLAPKALSTWNQGLKSPNFHLIPILYSVRLENLFWFCFWKASWNMLPQLKLVSSCVWKQVKINYDCLNFK